MWIAYYLWISLYLFYEYFFFPVTYLFLKRGSLHAMAQHQDKMKWKDLIPYGLSASQFGMALGFCGKVSDYINYERNIVGTSLEFVGNSFTAHGIKTEPKARALYEMLTGQRVYNGGFFVIHNGLLGCSPDGRVLVDEEPDQSTLPCMKSRCTSDADRRSESNCGVAASSLIRKSPKGEFIFKVPFQKDRTTHTSRHTSCDVISSVSSSPTASPVLSPFSSQEELFTRQLFWTQRQQQQRKRRRRQKVRLLEIKSPFRKLYGGRAEHYQPFGIPIHYMCQIQGQMAIAEADECDFFVYVESTGHVEAWRVHRSASFWSWAEPKLLQVTMWLRDGPPDSLDRTFQFEPFDFSTLVVEPLVFPFSIYESASLENETNFPFFSRFEYPYKPAQCVQSTSEDSEAVWICRMLHSRVVKFLFGSLRSAEGEDSDDERKGVTSIDVDVVGAIEAEAKSSHDVFHVLEWEKFVESLLQVTDVTLFSEEAETLLRSRGNTGCTVQLEIVDVNSGRLSLLLQWNDENVFSFPLHFYHRRVLVYLL